MQTDRFVHSHLPPVTEWPVFLHSDNQIQNQQAFNLVDRLLGGALQETWADRPLFRSASQTLSYRQVLALVNQRVRVLTEDCQLQAGNRVLIRGGNSIGFGCGEGGTCCGGNHAYAARQRNG